MTDGPGFRTKMLGYQDVDKATHGHDDPLKIDSVLRLTFKSESLPRSSDTGLTYGITLEGGQYDSMISGETVFMMIEHPAMPP